MLSFFRQLMADDNAAMRHYVETVEGSFVQGYWNGYIRALEHILEMEDE